MLKKILVPLDSSEIAEQAFPFPAELASRAHAAVTLAAVIVPAESWSGGPDPVFWQQAEEAAADRYLSGIEEGLRKRGIATHKKIAWGPAAATISRLAEGEGADLIVMGSRGLGPIRRLALGSVRGRGQRDDRDARCGREYLRRRLDAVESGQAVVHQHDVRPVLDRRGDGGPSVPDRRDDLDVGPHPEQELERIAKDVVVLDEHDPDWPHLRQGYSAPSRRG